ncbi:MAG: acetyl-CoA carboxylase, biotin carboxyl carrier protein [Tenericutes bacterium]|nr:acetyl-CoA carboxylase, biotin carboxyl carrier protein [Mycoplasmatota bacterium]
MDLKQMESFIQLLDETDIDELVWEKDGTKVAFKKGEGQNITLNQGKTKTEKKQIIKEGVTGKDELVKKTSFKDVDNEYVTIKSPMVGTFHIISPDNVPLVKEGDNIQVGQKIYIIEAMKILKGITSEKKGKIVKILIENGHAVEYGQSLFLIDPRKIKQQEGKDV